MDGPLWFWGISLALAAALFYPIRKMIWVLRVRRLERKQERKSTEEEQQAERKKAQLTAGLIAIVFALIYARTFFAS